MEFDLPHCSLSIPSALAWRNAIATHLGLLLLVLAPLGFLLYSIRHRRRYQKNVSVFIALCTGISVPLYVASVSNNISTSDWMVRFLLSTFGFSSFFKSLNVAFQQVPPGADNDIKTWLLWYTSMPEPQFVNGKLVMVQCDSKKNEISKHITMFLSRLLSLSIVVSILSVSSNEDNTPEFAIPGERISIPYMMKSLIHLWLIYTFASFCLEFGALLLVLSGFKPESTFDNPLLKARSYKECWGTRWNKPVHLFLKRTIYVPARKNRIHPYPATFLVFVASGLLHEYNFFIHNNAGYKPGHATMFFLYVGIFMILEELLLSPSSNNSINSNSALYLFKEKLPTFIVATLWSIPILPAFDYLFVRSWLKSGMLVAVRALTPHVQCRI